MAHKQIALDVSAFLDSREARALVDVPAEQVRKLAEIFVGLCYDHLAKAPRLIDAEDMRALARPADPVAPRSQGRARAARAGGDRGLPRSPRSDAARHPGRSKCAKRSTRRRRSSARRSRADASPTRSRCNKIHSVHGAAKLGRNDPCSCGSGQEIQEVPRQGRVSGAPVLRRFDRACTAPWWANGAHAQTLFGHLLPSRGERMASRRGVAAREIALEDGDRLRVYELAGTSGVRVHLFHGLSGDVDSDYMRRTASVLGARGHSVWAVNHRGCGSGRGLAARPYPLRQQRRHAGRARGEPRVGARSSATS